MAPRRPIRFRAPLSDEERREAKRLRDRQYRARRIAEIEEAGFSRRAAYGHARPGEPGLREVHARGYAAPGVFATGEGPAFDVISDATRDEMRRAGRYSAMVQHLAQGDITPGEFRTRVRRWAPLRGRRLSADPGVALAVSRTGQLQEAWERYSRRRGR